MDPVSLTTFIDFVCKGGTPKMTVVRQWKQKDDYSPVGDFYKRFRDTVQHLHGVGAPLSELDKMVKSLKDKKKQANYPDVVRGYKKWCGKHELDWFAPPRARWRSHALTVNVNPELGLDIDGVPHVIKLYLKGNKLAKNRADLITNLLAITCAKKVPRHSVMGVLDVREGKLYSPPAPNELLTTQLKGEAAYWCEVFDAV